MIWRMFLATFSNHLKTISVHLMPLWVDRGFFDVSHPVATSCCRIFPAAMATMLDTKGQGKELNPKRYRSTSRHTLRNLCNGGWLEEETSRCCNGSIPPVHGSTPVDGRRLPTWESSRNAHLMILQGGPPPIISAVITPICRAITPLTHLVSAI